jgi:hypothetical protein
MSAIAAGRGFPSSNAARALSRLYDRRPDSSLTIRRFGLLAGVLSLGLAACAGPGAGPAPNPAAIAVAPAPVPQRPTLEVAQLTSLKALTTQDLIDRLGRPDFTRRDPPAEIWQYRSSTCVLNVFLYPEDGGQMKVLDAATRDRDRLQAPENNCTPFGPTRSASAGS